jgi:hypothetical protein
MQVTKYVHIQDDSSSMPHFLNFNDAFKWTLIFEIVKHLYLLKYQYILNYLDFSYYYLKSVETQVAIETLLF